jgi:hypothetical protein
MFLSEILTTEHQRWRVEILKQLPKKKYVIGDEDLGFNDCLQQVLSLLPPQSDEEGKNQDYDMEYLFTYQQP